MLKNSRVDYKWVDLIFKDRPQIYGVFTSDHPEDRAEENIIKAGAWVKHIVVSLMGKEMLGKETKRG